jgi:hypothetical protein
MHYLRNMAALACALLAGCASIIDKHPKIAYADKRHPLSDTAIFSCAEVPGFTCGIIRVDDRSTWNAYNAGNTLWVRVLPGEHHVGVVASHANDINWLSFDIKDVQPGHAYSIEIATAPPPPPPVVVPGSHGKKAGKTNSNNKQQNAVATSMSVSYKDLGKMDSYTIRIGQNSIHTTKLTAGF